MNKRTLIGLCLLVFVITSSSEHQASNQIPEIDTTSVPNQEVNTNPFSKEVDSLFESIEKLNSTNEQKLKTIENLKEELDNKNSNIKQIRQDIKEEIILTKNYLDEYIQLKNDSMQILREEIQQHKVEPLKLDSIFYYSPIINYPLTLNRDDRFNN